MESTDTLDDHPPKSRQIMERKSLDRHQDTPWKTLEFSYTEEVAGSSPVPPTLCGAVFLGQPRTV
jgi:hypothetical protein